ncbi:MAG: NAD-binding protein [Lachnospiraceae bacterium]|nr:NAD-binding protein [Lachnospiraceae bacterium]
MAALLIVSMLCVAIFGYAIMCRIDRFVDRGGIIDSLQGRVNQGALVYGAPDVADKLQKFGIKCRALSEPSFPEDGFYSAIFALSANDDKNMVICNAAKRADPGIYIIARCNEPSFYEIFKSVGVKRILSANEPIDSLLAELGGDGRWT